MVFCGIASYGDLVDCPSQVKADLLRKLQSMPQSQLHSAKGPQSSTSMPAGHAPVGTSPAWQHAPAPCPRAHACSAPVPLAPGRPEKGGGARGTMSPNADGWLPHLFAMSTCRLQFRPCRGPLHGSGAFCQRLKQLCHALLRTAQAPAWTAGRHEAKRGCGRALCIQGQSNECTQNHSRNFATWQGRCQQNLISPRLGNLGIAPFAAAMHT